MTLLHKLETVEEWKGGKKSQTSFHKREKNSLFHLRVTSGDLAPILVTDLNVSGIKMTEINCPLELDGS